MTFRRKVSITLRLDTDFVFRSGWVELGADKSLRILVKPPGEVEIDERAVNTGDLCEK